MNATTTSNTQHIALDGPIGLAMAITVCIGLLALFAWALWRERLILGRTTAVLFWGLRGLALATILWMLLAPNQMRVHTSTTRRAIAVIVDVSGSMNTTDPPGTSDDLRWAVSLAGGEKYSATRSADRATAAVGIALQHLHNAADAIRQHKPENVVVESTTAASVSLERVKMHLQRLQETSELSGKSRSLTQRLVETLGGSEFHAFSQLTTTLQKGRTPSQKGWRESLPDLEHRITGLRRSLHELARLVESDEAKQVAQLDPNLISTAQSMPRLGRAAGFLGNLHQTVLTAIGDKADIRLTSFDRTVNPLSDPAAPEKSLREFLAVDGEFKSSALGTDISSVLEQLQQDRQEQPLAAVFLLSDVAHNQADSTIPQDIAATLTDTPVYVVPIGNTQHVRDIVLQSVSAPAVAMRNDDIVIEAKVQAYQCEGEVCVVKLLQDGEVVDFREVSLDSGFASRTVRFEQHMPAIGKQSMQIAITPLEGELTEQNNHDDFEVNVTRSNIKVLLADELPRWEYRYLTQLFRRDSRVECDELLFHPRMIATGRREPTRAFPITVDQWDQYDVVMLGDLPTEHLPVVAQQSLIEYLKQRGGTLVLIAGQQAMPHAYVDHPLEDILPVQPVDRSVSDADTYAFRVTEEGRKHHALMIGESEDATRQAWDFVNQFSPLHSVSRWRRPRPSAHNLIAAIPRGSLDEESAAKSSTFLCWQPVGRGRIVYLSGPDTYRLRFLRGDRLHYRFWGQLLRWAIAADLSAGTEFVRIRTDKSRYASREDVNVTVRLMDSDGEPVVADELEVRITSGGEQRSVPLTADTEIPGEYRAEVHALDPGVYRIEPTGNAVDELHKDSDTESASSSFTVQADISLELVDTRCDRALAKQISDITGGQVLPPTAVEEIIQLTDLEPIVTERIDAEPLWLKWKYLWIVFGCLQTEWIIRKWRGLS